jgi:formiminotetrahydrofolate cyclodeaminase
VALADSTIAEWLDELAARTPAPGGGAGAAFAAATAAALVEMAAAFAAARPAADANLVNVRDRAATLRKRLLELADEDALAYGAVLTARGDRAAMDTALSAAAEPPLKIATAAAEAAELAVAAATAPGNEHLLGDATAGAAIAEAAARAAARLVELNLERAPGDVRLLEARELSQRAADARARVERLRSD